MPHTAALSRRGLFTLICSLLSVYLVLWCFTGEWPFLPSTYNSYALQATRWLQGHLDLGQNYSYLEIAQYGGRYFISFPPIPSVLLLPLCLVFGAAAPDGLLSVVMSLLGAVYAMKLALAMGRGERSALFWALFLTVGSNFLHVGYCADVWYLAQTCSFAFTMLSFYYAMAGPLSAAWRSPLFLALAFGCRPLQIVYLPLVAWLLWGKLRGSGYSLSSALRRFWWWVLPPLAVGCFLMGLNFARFGDPFQFGHDYLPEFALEKENGQFHLSYLPGNFAKLWRLPTVEGGKVVFPTFNGCAFWLLSPIFLAFAVYLCKGARWALRQGTVLLASASILLHFLALCLHATMGGWQFGNRYTVDALPALYCALMVLLSRERSDLPALTRPAFLFGLCLNLVGTVALMNHWI